MGNVMIPLQLLKRVVELLEYWNLSMYDRAIRDEYGDILWLLKVKLQKIELRDAYAKIVRADDEDDRNDARIEYLRQRCQIGDVGYIDC